MLCKFNRNFHYCYIIFMALVSRDQNTFNTDAKIAIYLFVLQLSQYAYLVLNYSW